MSIVSPASHFQKLGDDRGFSSAFNCQVEGVALDSTNHVEERKFPQGDAMNKFAVAAIISLVMALAACGGGSGADPVATPAPSTNPPPSGEPSSGALIDVALTKGEIDPDTALKYKVFATFNDARLPAQFKGDDSGVFETDALQLLARSQY